MINAFLLVIMLSPSGERYIQVTPYDDPAACRAELLIRKADKNYQYAECIEGI